jgi:hypothetical protein
VFGLLATNAQNIGDWFKLRGYQPPPAIAQLATQDTMTGYAKHMFYLNEPAVSAKDDFAKQCPDNGGEQTIVLGCYHDHQNGIYLLSVTDSRLNGVEQVTAAHEMLHSAYERLSSGDRNKVDTMLQDYYKHGLTDARIREVIAAYQKSEPNAVVNEMHSVFGSEVGNLPAPLEEYYKHYFTNRQQVIGFAAQYQGEFTSRKAVIAADDAQLTSLKKQIDGGQSDLEAKEAAINAEQQRLIGLRNSDVPAYNAAVPGYNAMVDAYNVEVNTVRNLISQYNQLVAARNAVALEENQLFQALTGSPSPISQ